MATVMLISALASAGSAAATVGAATTISAGLAAAAPALMAATSLLTGVASIRQGEAQEVVLNQQAKEESVSAKDQELERRKQTLHVLAAQNVAIAAGGITGGGSARVLQEEAEKVGSRDVLSLRAGSEQRAATLRSRGRFARQGGRISAASSLLQSGMTSSRV